ncbi:MAG: hypothetical protein KGH63_03405, partial [Candidatus Micrarchaeota archaeon]|nr:hypothetical protein [Candidatus Micrarchaeota archaeon]
MAVANPIDLASSLADGFTQAVQQVGATLPNLVLSIILAAIVMVVGVFVAGLLGGLATKIMNYLKVENAFKKFKLEDALGGNQISPILAAFVRWYVMLLFLQQAIILLGMGSLTTFI